MKKQIKTILVALICTGLLVLGQGSLTGSHPGSLQQSALHRMAGSHLLAVTLYPTDQPKEALTWKDNRHDFEDLLDERNTLVIGNGGAGYAGLIQFLAATYNAQRSPKDQIVLGWKFADSHMNLSAIEQGALGGGECDLYITYEPHLEARLQDQGHLRQIVRLFNDEFPLIGPRSNPANLTFDADPVENVAKIIEYGLSHENAQEKVYFSRWNHSAMGVKDQAIWCHAVDFLAARIVGEEKVPAFRPEVRARVHAILVSPELNKEARTRQVADAMLKVFLDHHVLKPSTGRMFPAGAIGAAVEEQLYAITDGAQLAEFGIQDLGQDEQADCVVFNHGDKRDEGHLLTNPAQLLVPVSFENFSADSAQAQFLAWLTSEQGRSAICHFVVEGCDQATGAVYNGHVDPQSFTTALEVARMGEDYLYRCQVPN